MDKITLKIVGDRLRREFAALEQMPFPLQKALAELARKNTDASSMAQNDSDQTDPHAAADQQRPSTRR